MVWWDKTDNFRQYYEDIAHALGIEHVPDMGPSWPGSIEEVLAEIRALQKDRQKLYDFLEREHSNDHVP